MSASGASSLFVKTDGTLWAVGRNDNGQLGDGTKTDRSTPVQVADAVSSVLLLRSVTHFLKADGTLWAMGNNYLGTLGDETTIDRTKPVQVCSGVASLSGNGFRTKDGSLWQWGSISFYGYSPLGSDVQMVANGSNLLYPPGFRLFLRNDGTLWAMGGNYYGQLGDGTSTDRSTPVQVATGVASMQTGSGFSMFVTADGTLWGMGKNSYGQLGDGTTTSASSPIPVTTGVTKA